MHDQQSDVIFVQQQQASFSHVMCVCDRGHISLQSISAMDNAVMNKRVSVMERARLLGGSAADWLVLVGGILLDALFAAIFLL